MGEDEDDDEVTVTSGLQKQCFSPPSQFLHFLGGACAPASTAVLYRASRPHRIHGVLLTLCVSSIEQHRCVEQGQGPFVPWGGRRRQRWWLVWGCR